MGSNRNHVGGSEEILSAEPASLPKHTTPAWMRSGIVWQLDAGPPPPPLRRSVFFFLDVDGGAAGPEQEPDQVPIPDTFILAARLEHLGLDSRHARLPRFQP